MRRACLLTAILLIGQVALAVAATKVQKKPLPSFAKVKPAVAGYFAGLPDYQQGGIITRGEAQAALKQVEKLGWKVAQSAELLAKVPDEGELLVTELRTPGGKKFMRQIAKLPLAYDRMDRLTRLPHGPQTLKDLIRGPDGYKMIQYMTTSAGGQELGKMLSQAPQGSDFNRPTGRIYTVEALLDHLKKAHQAATKGTA